MALSNTDNSDETSTLVLSRSKAIGVAIAALVAAGAPHFFLDTPLAFFAQDNVSGWFGLSIWAPTFLAAVALFAGADLTARSDQPLTHSVDLRMAAGLSLPIVVAVALGAINFDGYQRISWGTLSIAAAVYAGVFAVGTSYWQAVVQRELLAGWPPLSRPLVVAAGAALLWLPFAANHPLEEVGELMAEHAIAYLAVGLLFELGLPVYACMASAAVMGVGFAWAHQMTFF
ncbi:MAG: hypothetical protein ACLFVJ_02280 [Persicimonas sp.]